MRLLAATILLMSLASCAERRCDGWDPLVLDIDGDGVETTTAEAGVRFRPTLDADPVQTAWLLPDDAFLALDANRNRTIDGATELFTDLGGHPSGFAALAALDSNGDGAITVVDEQFMRLLLWRDRNQDGLSQRQELNGLFAVGIRSLGLHAEPSTGDAARDAQGNGVPLRGTFERRDGTLQAMVDVVFQTSTPETVLQGK